MKKVLIAVLLLTVVSTGLVYAQSGNTAQSLAQRFAIGFSMVGIETTGFSSSEFPSLTARYWLDDNVSAEGSLGFNSGNKSDLFYASGKILAIVQNYKSFNLYVTAFAGFGKIDVNDDSKTVLKIGTGFGVEWFVLDNLSISSELGLSYFDIADQDSSFGIYADWIPRAGIRYYI